MPGEDCEGSEGECAFGLTDDEIVQLLKLVRTETNERVLEIISVGEDAVVQTGMIAGGEAGNGMRFLCVRDGDGWKVKERFAWIA